LLARLGNPLATFFPGKRKTVSCIPSRHRSRRETVCVLLPISIDIPAGSLSTHTHTHGRGRGHEQCVLLLIYKYIDAFTGGTAPLLHISHMHLHFTMSVLTLCVFVLMRSINGRNMKLKGCEG
jgi:hypothetical protein